MAEPCGQEVAALKDNIRKLENKLLLATWQIGHLRNHKYFKPVQPHVPKAEFELEAGGKETSNGTSGIFDGALSNPLSPAGSLIVYDRGEKRAALFAGIFYSFIASDVFSLKNCVFLGMFTSPFKGAASVRAHKGSRCLPHYKGSWFTAFRFTSFNNCSWNLYVSISL